MNLLIVDDDKDLLEMVSFVLRRHHMQVECLDNGAMLLPYLSKKRPDVILLDVFLGNSNGQELSREIKTTPGLKDIPIIIYSAGNVLANSMKENSLADEFLMKPFEISHLVEMISRLARR
jgi:DNA-binding response OmpR family regulator